MGAITAFCAGHSGASTAFARVQSGVWPFDVPTQSLGKVCPTEIAYTRGPYLRSNQLQGHHSLLYDLFQRYITWHLRWRD